MQYSHGEGGVFPDADGWKGRCSFLPGKEADPEAQGQPQPHSPWDPSLPYTL